MRTAEDKLTRMAGLESQCENSFPNLGLVSAMIDGESTFSRLSNNFHRCVFLHPGHRHIFFSLHPKAVLRSALNTNLCM